MASAYTKPEPEEPGEPTKPGKPAKPDIRMVLVGKTGTGKSAAGNTILGKKVFESKISPATVTSQCQKEEVESDDKLLAVVDTPGLFDTTKTEEQVTEAIVRCISLSAPGPHVFLVVIEPKRFTKEEQKSVEIIQTIFGEQAARYTMVLFTHGDDLEADEVTIEEFINESRDLRDFTRQCGGGFHVFNNRSQDRSQVTELLQKIDMMVQRNGESFYTNEMLQEAERAIQEEMNRLLRENPGMGPVVARRQAENNNTFIMKVLAGLLVAGVAFAVFHPNPAYVTNAAVKAAMTAITAAIKKRKCVIQ